MAPYGLDLQYLHYLAHYKDGDWDHAQQIADGFPVRVTSISEARLSAMALFIDVARGSPRSRSAGPGWSHTWRWICSPSTSLTGCFAEDAYWAGDLAGALTAATRLSAAATAWGGEEYGAQVIRPAAVGIAALADQARQARAAGQPADALVAEARALADIARQGVDSKYRVATAIGVDGRGWLARAEAELRRAAGENDPENWQAVVDTFGPGFVYETAKSRWRLAEALAEVGQQGGSAAAVAARCGRSRRSRRDKAAGRTGRPGPPGPARIGSRAVQIAR